MTKLNETQKNNNNKIAIGKKQMKRSNFDRYILNPIFFYRSIYFYDKNQKHVLTTTTTTNLLFVFAGLFINWNESL